MHISVLSKDNDMLLQLYYGKMEDLQMGDILSCSFTCPVSQIAGKLQPCKGCAVRKRLGLFLLSVLRCSLQ